MKKWILLLLLSSWALHAMTQPLTDQQFIGMLDLTRADMKTVAQYANAANYTMAVKVWRDSCVNRLRRMDLGEFGWHSDRLNGKFMRWAEFLVMDPNMPASTYYSSSPPYYDYYGLRGLPGSTAPINWLGTPSGTMQSNGGSLSTFIMMNALAAKYWNSGNIIYLNKYLDVVRDFSSRQKLLIESLSASARTAYTPDWTQNAQETLDQGTRVKNIIRGLALLSKNLPGESKISSWNNVLTEIRPGASSTQASAINASWLANIAAGLVRDNPGILLTRYQYAGAVPNQRLNGICAILFIGSAFPEFKASPAFMNTATASLDDYLSTMMYPDGAMLEQSFNYNDGDAAELAGMNDIFNTGRVSIATSTKTKIDQAVLNYRRMTWALRTPHMVVPLVGNVGHSKAPQLWKDATTASAYVTSKASQSSSDILTQQICNAYKGQTSGVPSFTSVSFPYAGYYTQRNGWHWNSQYLFFNAARSARGHKMADNNGIQLVAHGRDMLVTDGPPDYFGSLAGPVSQKLNEGSSFKANTVMVDGQSQTKTPILTTTAKSTITRPYCHTAAFDFADGLYTQGYGAIGSVTPSITQVSHTRKVIYLKNSGLWLVADLMQNTGTTSHTYKQTWNFAPWLPTANTFGYTSEQIVVDAAGKKIFTNDAAGPNVLLQHVGTMPSKSYKSYYNDATTGLGYYATAISAATPAKDVHAEWTTAGNSTLGTLIHPSAGLVPTIAITDASDNKNLKISFKAPNGDEIRFASGFDVSTQTHFGFTVSAQTFLLLKQTNGIVNGLVNGASGSTIVYNTQTITPGWKDYTFEFNPMSNTITFKKMETPDTFQWTSAPAPKIVSILAAPYTFNLGAGCSVVAPVVVSSVQYLQGAVATPLSATGNNLKWYSTETGGTGSTLTPIPNTAVVGITNYYVSQTINGCESPRSKITVTVSAPVSNKLPVVSLTSPLGGASYTAPASIAITALASDADGNISKVEFYAGSTLLGTDLTSPYSYTWTGVATGTYSLSSKAYDNLGASTKSAAVDITVKGIVNSTIGINGPSCVTAGQTYTYTLVPEFSSASTFNMWSSSGAVVTQDLVDKKKFSVQFPSYLNGSTITLTSGINYTTSPWYKEYAKSVKIGGCTARSSSALINPYPATDESIIQTEDGSKIIELRLLDLNGREIYYQRCDGQTEVSCPAHLPSGMYMIQIITDQGTLVQPYIKAK